MRKIKCYFFGHTWDKYSGWYGERIARNAKCKRCGKPYKDVIVQYE